MIDCSVAVIALTLDQIGSINANILNMIKIFPFPSKL